MDELSSLESLDFDLSSIAGESEIVVSKVRWHGSRTVVTALKCLVGEVLLNRLVLARFIDWTLVRRFDCHFDFGMITRAIYSRKSRKCVVILGLTRDCRF